MFHFFGNITDRFGNGLQGWQVEVFDGENVASIYSDDGLTALSSNRATSDAQGNFDLYVVEGLYGLRYYDTAGVLRRTDVNVNMQGGVSAATIDFKRNLPDTVPVSVEVKSAETISVYEWGVKLNGIDDDTVALNKAIAACAGKRLVMPDGTARITGPLNIGVDYFELSGAGPGASTIYRAGDFGDTFRIRNAVPGTLQRLALSGLNVYSAVRPTLGSHIEAEAVNGLELRNLDLNDPYCCISLLGVYKPVLLDINSQYAEGSPTGRVGLQFLQASPAYGAGICANASVSQLQLHSIWNPSSSGTPGLDTALYATAIDGLWLGDFYFGSAAQALVKMHNTSGEYVTGVKLENGWLDHGTGVLFQTAGTAAGNFGKITLASVRMFGGGRTTGMVEIQGNPKSVIFSGCDMNATNGNGVLIALSGDGRDVQLNGCTIEDTNMNGAGGVPLRILSGSYVSMTGGRIDGTGVSVSSTGIYDQGGAYTSIQGVSIRNCNNPIGLDAGASNYTVIGNSGGGHADPTIASFGSGSKLLANNNFTS